MDGWCSSSYIKYLNSKYSFAKHFYNIYGISLCIDTIRYHNGFELNVTAFSLVWKDYKTAEMRDGMMCICMPDYVHVCILCCIASYIIYTKCNVVVHTVCMCPPSFDPKVGNTNICVKLPEIVSKSHSKQSHPEQHL